MPGTSLLTRRSFLSIVAGATVSLSLLGQSSPALSNPNRLDPMLNQIRATQQLPSQSARSALARQIFSNIDGRFLARSSFGQFYNSLHSNDQKRATKGMVVIATNHLVEIFLTHQINRYNTHNNREVATVSLLEGNVLSELRIFVTGAGIYDIELDGVSLVHNLRYQTQNLYQQTGGNVRAIIKALRDAQR